MDKSNNFFIFIGLGFFFYSHFITVLVICILWELMNEYYKTDKTDISSISYKKINIQEKLNNIGTNMISYYIGHYIRNKLPL